MAVHETVYRDGKGVRVTTLVGQVVGSGSTYLGEGDSSYWIDYFDFETGEFKVKGYGYWQPTFEVDAPESVLAAWEAKRAAEFAAAKAASALSAAKVEYWESQRPVVERGTPVQVVKGRKVPVGTTGTVFWVGESTWGDRVGFTDAEGTTHWTARTNVEPVFGPALPVAERSARAA